jgi:hypothetical protein
MSGDSLFLIGVEDDLPDAVQSELRTEGLYPAGHMGMSTSGNTRAGSCMTFFNVIARTRTEAYAKATNVLARLDRQVACVAEIG